MTLTFECQVHFDRRGRGAAKSLAPGAAPPPPASGRVPRVSRLMALALHFDRLIQKGAVADYAQLAELGHVTRARMSQIMNLLNLPPELQEALLFLPRTLRGRDPIILHVLQSIGSTMDW